MYRGISFSSYSPPYPWMLDFIKEKRELANKFYKGIYIERPQQLQGEDAKECGRMWALANSLSAESAFKQISDVTCAMIHAWLLVSEHVDFSDETTLIIAFGETPFAYISTSRLGGKLKAKELLEKKFGSADAINNYMLKKCGNIDVVCYPHEHSSWEFIFPEEGLYKVMGEKTFEEAWKLATTIIISFKKQSADKWPLFDICGSLGL